MPTMDAPKPKAPITISKVGVHVMITLYRQFRNGQPIGLDSLRHGNIYVI